MLILTIHGLGGTSFSHYPMKKYLETYLKIDNDDEKIDIQSFDYPSKTIDFTDIISQIEDYLDNYSWVNDSETAILIGHSLGGIVCTNINHKRVKGVITVSTPHTGCNLAEIVKYYAPKLVSDMAFGKMYDVLTANANNSTIPKIICITSSLFPLIKFDGRVHTNEMIHPQAYKTMHLEYSGHLTQLFDVRLFRLIYDGVLILLE